MLQFVEPRESSLRVLCVYAYIIRRMSIFQTFFMNFIQGIPWNGIITI